MWTIRFVLIGFLIAIVTVSGYFLSRRTKYQHLLENGVFNLALVIVYNLLCFFLTGLPSDQNAIPPPNFFMYPFVRKGYFVIGLGIIVISVLIMAMAIRQRKTVGGQNIKEGLLTLGFINILGILFTQVLLECPWR